MPHHVAAALCDAGSPHVAAPLRDAGRQWVAWRACIAMPLVRNARELAMKVTLGFQQCERLPPECDFSQRPLAQIGLPEIS